MNHEIGRLIKSFIGFEIGSSRYSSRKDPTGIPIVPYSEKQRGKAPV